MRTAVTFALSLLCATPVMANRQEFASSPELGRSIWERIRLANAAELAVAQAQMLARGWKPTARYDGVVLSRRAKAVPGITPIGWQQDFWSDESGEVAVWYWDNGDPSDVEFELYVKSYQTGEDVIVEGSYYDTGQWDVTELRWFNYVGGSAYRDFIRERGGLVPVAHRSAVHQGLPCQQAKGRGKYHCV